MTTDAAIEIRPNHVAQPSGAYRVWPLGIVLHNHVIPSFDEWDALGTWLSVVDQSVQWWVGDWVRIGEREYGEMFSQLLDATQWDADTVHQYRWVADRVPFENRRTDLSFSHHREVADLDSAQQVEWLERAATGTDGKRWTVERLRRELNAVKRDEDVKFWVTIEANDAEDAEKLAERMRAEGRRVKVR